MKLKIKEPGRLAFSLISFKYQPNIDHPVEVAQELVAENHVYGHDYILVAANIDKVLSHKNKLRFTLHKVDGKGTHFIIRCSSNRSISFFQKKNHHHTLKFRLKKHLQLVRSTVIIPTIPFTKQSFPPL